MLIAAARQHGYAVPGDRVGGYLCAMKPTTRDLYSAFSLVLVTATAFLGACIMEPEEAEDEIGSTIAESTGAPCDVVQTGAGDDDIIYGTLYKKNSLGWFMPKHVGTATGPLTYRMVMCTRSDGGNWTYSTTECTSSTPAANRPWIVSGAGDDRIAPAQSFVNCGLPSDYAVGPAQFASVSGTFQFGVVLLGGSGSDELYGSGNDDYLLTNNLSGQADSSYDVACGMAGSDTLIGDKDDSRSQYECLHGSSNGGSDGYDTCDGLGTRSDGKEYDRYRSCDSTSSARVAGDYLSRCNGRWCLKPTKCKTECASIPDLSR